MRDNVKISLLLFLTSLIANVVINTVFKLDFQRGCDEVQCQILPATEGCDIVGPHGKCFCNPCNFSLIATTNYTTACFYNGACYSPICYSTPDIVFWGILIFAIVVLAAMAYCITRMDNKKKDPFQQIPEPEQKPVQPRKYDIATLPRPKRVAWV